MDSPASSSNYCAKGDLYVVWGSAGVTGNRLLRFVAVSEKGVQDRMSANQTRIITIRPEAGSRMNTVFLVLIFACGAAGGAVGSAFYHAGGWPLVCICGICVSAAGFTA